MSHGEMTGASPAASAEPYRLLQSLIGIRLRSVTDPNCQRHLAWLGDVLAALALMNRRLSDDGWIAFGEYLDDVAGFWRRSLGDRKVSLVLRADDIALPQETAAVLAIVVHELLNNAVRHAFEDGRRGSIAIACSRGPDGVSLVVRDTGAGAATLTPRDGLSLVEGLVRHMGGEFETETASGAGLGARILLPVGSPVVSH